MYCNCFLSVSTLLLLTLQLLLNFYNGGMGHQTYHHKEPEEGGGSLGDDDFDLFFWTLPGGEE